MLAVDAVVWTAVGILRVVIQRTCPVPPAVASLALNPTRVNLAAHDRPNAFLVALRHWKLIELVQKEDRRTLTSRVITRKLLCLSKQPSLAVGFQFRPQGAVAGVAQANT